MNLNKLATSLIAQARATHRALSARRGIPRQCPRREPGVELIGPYQDSGYKEPPHIVRRPDGQVIQLSRLLYLLLAEADGNQDDQQLAAVVSRRFGQTLSAENVAFLVQTKLAPAGLVCSPDGERVIAKRADPLLALRYRAAVVPPGVVRAVSRVLRPLFLPAFIGAALSWLVVLDVWLVQHGIAGAVHQLIAQPVLLLALLALVIVSAVWHEAGHATACTYGGARPGALGIGLYVIWPAFYTDVTDAYRLRRAGRLRTDLGGVYFNALFALAAGGAYFATRFEPLLALVLLQHCQIIQQLTPLLRLDGYYVVTDLVGVPDVLSRLKPLLLSLIPFRATDARVRDLKPWVRAVAGAYVLLFVIAAAGLLALVAWNGPHFLPAAVHSGLRYSHHAATAWHEHHVTTAVLAEVQVLCVALPAVGLMLGAVRLFRRLAGRAGRLLGPRVRVAAGLAVAVCLGFVGPLVLWGREPAPQAATAADRLHVHDRNLTSHYGGRPGHDPKLASVHTARPSPRSVPNAASSAATANPTASASTRAQPAPTQASSLGTAATSGGSGTGATPTSRAGTTPTTTTTATTTTTPTTTSVSPATTTTYVSPATTTTSTTPTTSTTTTTPTTTTTTGTTNP